MEHHSLDPYPIPKDKKPLYINEPWLIDKSLLEYPHHREPDEKEDNIRIYLPMDLNKDAILRRLDNVIGLYGEAREDNEIEFSIDVHNLKFMIRYGLYVICRKRENIVEKQKSLLQR